MSLPTTLILSSKSPRRQELLSSLDIPFEVQVRSIDETWPQGLPLHEVPEYLARRKAEAFTHHLPVGGWVLTADTVVIINEQILGKPANAEQAAQMLQQLSGKTHQVVSGYCFSNGNTHFSGADTAQVHMLPLSPEEIQLYIEHYKPMDKAGSYGIQEWIGLSKVSRIEGSYYTIMGLPTHLVWQTWQQIKSLGY